MSENSFFKDMLKCFCLRPDFKECKYSYYDEVKHLMPSEIEEIYDQ